MSGFEGPAVLAPIAGDPAEVRRVAAGLGAEADLLAALARTVRGLADPSVTVWASPAGRAFAHRAGAVPGVVERVGHRYGVAAAALRRLAQALQEAQAQVARAQRVHEQAWAPFLRAGDQLGLAESSPDPVQRALAGRWRAEMVAHGEHVQVAVRQHAQAHDEYAVADRACAEALRGLLDDGLADSRLYATLTATGRGAAEAAEVFGAVALLPPARPLAVGAVAVGSVGLAAEAVVLVAYGDGDLSSLALGTAATALGGAAPVLKAGARATNATAVRAATTRSARRELRLTRGDRVAAGIAAAAPGLSGQVGRRWASGKGLRMVEPPKPRPSQPWTRPPLPGAALRPWLHEQTAVRAANWAKTRWVDDLTTVLRADGASTRWHVAGLAADGAARGLHGGAVLRRRELDAREAADLQQSGQRHR